MFHAVALEALTDLAESLEKVLGDFVLELEVVWVIGCRVGDLVGKGGVEVRWMKGGGLLLLLILLLLLLLL